MKRDIFAQVIDKEEILTDDEIKSKESQAVEPEKPEPAEEVKEEKENILNDIVDSIEKKVEGRNRK